MSDEIISLSEKQLSGCRAFCGLSGRYKAGYDKKIEWMKAHWPEGLRYKICKVDRGNAGFIEYLPGELAWRGVQAEGYLFIHCLWVIGRNRGHGYGRTLLDACIQDARDYLGVAVVISKTHWLPTARIFIQNGFEVVDHAPPSFDLMVWRNSPDSPLPQFRKNWYKATDFEPGLTLIKSAQCPYIDVMEEGINQLGCELNIPMHIVELRSAREAQNSPSVYGVMGLFYNGELLTYHPMGIKQLKTLLEARI